MGKLLSASRSSLVGEKVGVAFVISILQVYGMADQIDERYVGHIVTDCIVYFTTFAGYVASSLFILPSGSKREDSIGELEN